MLIHYGYHIQIECAAPTPLIAKLDTHPTERHRIVASDAMSVRSLANGAPVAAGERHWDAHGNLCRWVAAPAGGVSIQASGVLRDHGRPDPTSEEAIAHPPERLPHETLLYLLGSRYCETDQLSQQAWSLFGGAAGGWRKVQAVCDFVHARIRFDYDCARSTRTAVDALEERAGVCRDYAHLAIAFCRALNIPARYCTGYLGDIGVPRDPAPMDFSAWFEVYLGSRWWTFDARHNQPRIGRIVIARGRDAADVAIITSFGQHQLSRFEVLTEEFTDPALERAMA
jgi:transglutaminase-like putative cysteine protease